MFCLFVLLRTFHSSIQHVDFYPGFVKCNPISRVIFFFSCLGNCLREILAICLWKCIDNLRKCRKLLSIVKKIQQQLRTSISTKLSTFKSLCIIKIGDEQMCIYWDLHIENLEQHEENYEIQFNIQHSVARLFLLVSGGLFVTMSKVLSSKIHCSHLHLSCSHASFQNNFYLDQGTYMLMLFPHT